MTDETLIQENEVLKAIADLSAQIKNIDTKLDKFIDETNVQFEAIRTGTLANNIAFERLTGKVFTMSANLIEMQEEARRRFAADLLAIEK